MEYDLMVSGDYNYNSHFGSVSERNIYCLGRTCSLGISYNSYLTELFYRYGVRKQQRDYYAYRSENQPKKFHINAK